MAQVKRKRRAFKDDGTARHDGDQSEDGGGQARGNQTLPVADLPANFNGIPLDGAQYLAVVRKQACAAPSIIRAERPNATGTMAATAVVAFDTLIDEAPALLPLPSWRAMFLQRFRNMRESLSNRPAPDGGAQIGVPCGTSARKWFCYLHGQEPIKTAAQAGANSTTTNGRACQTARLRSPGVALLQHLQTAQILALITAFTVWFEESWHTSLEHDQQIDHIPAIVPFHSQWLFAALAHLEERLVGDDVSTLRNLARACIERIRQARMLRKDPFDLAESGAWIVVCAIAGVWGQHDLWQDAESRLRSLQQAGK